MKHIMRSACTLCDNLNIDFFLFYSAHFKLKFLTIADTGVLFYAEGNYHRTDTYDFEGLFLRDGFLHYFLFNPPRNSHGSSFGFHGKSTKRVNDGVWHEVKNVDLYIIRSDR